ncbi:helix-turn-helix domain-containing protein [Streptomyces sp. NBC_01613]|uniref:helix-turn-helix transcriptional regulator n=1 Tax=Streptomyces sp. NBC_01613 TaxID=2975896 RepID=UPI00386E587A
MNHDHERDRETPRRRAVLDVLRNAAAPLGVNDVAETVGVHPNTVRFHLEALMTQGAVEWTLETSSGPGRPRTVYAPRRGMNRGGKRGYQLLARILLSQLASTETDAETAAIEAGRAWGQHLMPPAPPFHTMTEREATDRLSELLADLGFDPQADGDLGKAPDRIRLRHCPFLELAEEYGQIVCPLHLGLMKGALAQLRAPVEASRLEPFAESDVCLAHLTPAHAA